jgi:hypothetical protein
VKSWHRVGLAVATLASLVAGFFGEAHGPWGSIPLFWGGFGFAGCVLIIVISKAIGRHLLTRSEDYYARTEDPDRGS